MITFAWEHSEPVTTLEARAVLNALRWRGRHRAMVASRFVHLTDSQVFMGAMSHAGSPSPPLNRIIGKICALLLVTSSRALFILVPTNENPAHRPSRRAADKGGEKNAASRLISDHRYRNL